MMGEIGGNAEEQAAALKKSGEFTKPLAAFIAGQTAPRASGWATPARSFRGRSGKASDKIDALEDAGIRVAKKPRRHGRRLEGCPQRLIL